MLHRTVHVAARAWPGVFVLWPCSLGAGRPRDGRTSLDLGAVARPLVPHLPLPLRGSAERRRIRIRLPPRQSQGPELGLPALDEPAVLADVVVAAGLFCGYNPGGYMGEAGMIPEARPRRFI